MTNGILPGALFVLSLLAANGGVTRAAEPSPRALAGFNRYVAAVEARLVGRHSTAGHFLALTEDGATQTRMGRGALVIEEVAADRGAAEGAMLHHWRGTAFVRGATAAEFERLLRDFSGYPQRFAPQVTRTEVLREEGDRATIRVRMVQKRALTVVLDAEYGVDFGRLDGAHRFSLSRSRSIEEVSAAGTRNEHALSAEESHGFLWRQNTYWSVEERDGGLLIEIETVSLSRTIPYGLGWALGPYVESIPRESLAFTLGRMREALSNASPQAARDAR